MSAHDVYDQDEGCFALYWSLTQGYVAAVVRSGGDDSARNGVGRGRSCGLLEIVYRYQAIYAWELKRYALDDERGEDQEQ